MRADRLAALILLATTIPMPAAGQDGATGLGTIVRDGIVMTVAGAVAVWDGERERLRVNLFPFTPTDDEIDLCRRGRESRIERPPIDPATWPRHNPRAYYSIAWMPDRKVGSHDNATVYFYAYGIGGANENVNLNYLMDFDPDGIEGTLTGTLASGETIHLVAKGTDELDGKAVTWDLDVRTVLHSPLPRGE